MGPTTPIAAPSQQAGNSDVPIGTVRQPTLADPGWVAGITLGELYTDNLKLAASGTPKQSSWITEIQPFLKAAYSGPRFSGLVDSSLTGYLYAGQSRYNQLSPSLNAQGTLTLLPQHFFVDGTAMYGREVINNQLSAAPGSFFVNNNSANVAIWTLSPYWIQDLGNVGTASLRYSYGRVLYNTKGIPAQNGGLLYGIPNITSNALQFNLASPKDETWGWNLGYSDQRIQPDFGSGRDYAVAQLGGSVQVSNNTRLLADVGKESNFLPDGTVDKLGANFWDAGFEWANGLYRLKATVGHRFYGRTFDFSWVRTAALLTTTLSYVEQPTDINQQLLGQNPGQIITTPTGYSSLPSLRESQVYLMKRATASAYYEMPRGRLGLTLYDERRTYLTLNKGKEKIANANLDWQFNIGASTSLTPTLGWQRYQFQNGQIRYSTYEQLALVHQFNPKNFVSLQLRHDSSSVHSATTDVLGYGANVILLQFTHLF